MPWVVLLGDSIVDHAAYVVGGPVRITTEGPKTIEERQTFPHTACPACQLVIHQVLY